MLLKEPSELDSRAVILITGRSGTGKTSQCRFLENTAFLSMESGDLCFKKYGYKPSLKAVIKTSDDLGEVFSQLKAGIKGIDYVFIDSLTEMGELVLSELKNDPKYADPKNMLKMYGAYKDVMVKIIKSYRDLDQYTVIFTCLDKKEKNGVETFDEFNIPGSIKDSIKGFVDIALHMQSYTDEEGKDKRVFVTSDALSRLAKDRSGLLEKIEDADLSVILNKLKG